MPYVDLNTIHNPSAGGIPPASWGDQVRDNLEFLIDPPACSVYGSAAQSVGTSSTETMLANSENFDNASMHSTSSNTGRITATTAGRYLVFCTVVFDADADGNRRVDFRVNGSDAYKVFNLPAVSSVSESVLTGARALILNASDYVEVRVTHTAGNDLDVTLEEFGATFLTRI